MANASGNAVWVEVDFKEVAAMFTRLSQLGAKGKDITPILKKAAAPLRQEAKAQAPKNKRTVNTIHATVRKHFSGGKMRLKTQIHAPGNLQKSIDFIKNKYSASILFVGNMTARTSRYDGWYGRLVTFGHRTRKGKISRNKETAKTQKGIGVVPENDFMGRAYNSKGSNVAQILTSGLIDLIEKLEKG